MKKIDEDPNYISEKDIININQSLQYEKMKPYVTPGSYMRSSQIQLENKKELYQHLKKLNTINPKTLKFFYPLARNA